MIEADVDHGGFVDANNRPSSMLAERILQLLRLQDQTAMWDGVIKNMQSKPSQQFIPNKTN
jgi:hypothetical protein